MPVSHVKLLMHVASPSLLQTAKTYGLVLPSRKVILSPGLYFEEMPTMDLPTILGKTIFQIPFGRVFELLE